MRARAVLKRLLWMFPTLGVITLLSYAMMRAAPGDPVRAAMLAGDSGDGDARKAGESAAAREFRRRYHLDQPWIVGYWRWLVGAPEPGRGGLLHGEWAPGRWFGRAADGDAPPSPPVAEADLPPIRLVAPAPTRIAAAPEPVPENNALSPEPVAPDYAPPGFFTRAAAVAGRFFNACYRLVAGDPGRHRGGIVHGDFGTSIVYTRGAPVWDVMREPMFVTIKLQCWSMAIVYLIALPFGLYSAVFRGTWPDRSVSFVFFVLYSLPSYWVGLLLILLAGRFAPWWPISGLTSTLPADASYWRVLGDTLWHYVLPVFCLSFGSFASLSRYARVSVLETIRMDYVRTARAKGLSEWTVVTRHVMRNSLITMVTLFAGLLPGLLGGSILVEYLFTINGLGSLMQHALASRDYPILMTNFGLSATLVLVGILLSDLLYTVVDPRIELE